MRESRQGLVGPGSYAHIVALGSSFAAGPGIRPMEKRSAGRSRRNYAHLTAEALGARLTDATVSGATTNTVLYTPQRVGLVRFPPQVESISPGSDVDLVTITAGGNDVKYVGSMTQAAVGGWLTAKPATRTWGRRMRHRAIRAESSEVQVQAAADGLRRVVDEVRLRAPRARILLVSYLTLVGPDTRPSPSVPLSPDEIEHFRNVGSKVLEAFTRAAETSLAELIDVTTPSIAHGLGSADPWVFAFPADLRSVQQTMFHPNSSGMAAVSEKILSHLAR